MSVRRVAVAAIGLVVMGALAACTADPEPAATTGSSAGDGAHTPGIRLVAPEEPVLLGDEVVIIVEVTGDDGPRADAEVTFDVVSGDASFPGGFDTDTTDELGIATSLALEPSAAGTVTVRVATDVSATEVTVEISE